MKYELAVKGGLTVLEDGVRPADIFISKGKIARITKPGTGEAYAARSLDASGLTVLPGIIDAHVHYSLHLDANRITADNFLSGSAAAAAGGVTTVIDYTGQGPGVPLAVGLKQRLEEAEGLMNVDYSFHSVIPSWKYLDDPAGQMKELMKLGVTSFKFFTAYEKRGLMASDAELFSALEASRQTGALICVHAENGSIIDLLVDRFKRIKKKTAAAHPLSRPDFTEWEAVGRALIWAGQTGGNLYFVHLSSGVSAELIKQARAAGVRALGETCPQYLALSQDLFKRKDGHLYATCPPVRAAKDSKALWSGINSGAVKVVATDNCTFTRAQKDAWNWDISKLPMGIPGTQTLLPLMHTYGVKSGKMTVAGLASVLCSNPAKIMGLYPQKGAIKPGSDADLAIIDTDAVRKVDFKELRHNTDYSAYQGLRLTGWAKHTILRGKIIASDGRLTSPDKPAGRFIRRKRAIVL